MELKTDIEKLNRIAAKAENLVERLKQFVFDNGIDGPTGTAMGMSEAENFTKLIGRKLEAININGDEDVLSDIIAIYDKAIKSIEEELEKNKDLEVGHIDKFNDATIESFNNVKKVLENSKGKKAGPLKDILDELSEEKASGEIDEEYRDSKIEEINAETRNIEAEITANTSGLEDLEYKTRNERAAYDEMSRLTKEYFALKKEIEDIDRELGKPDISDETKADLEGKKANKEKTLISIIKDINEKTYKAKEYKQDKNESDRDYLERIQSNAIAPDMYAKQALTIKQGELENKLKSLEDMKIRVYNSTTKKFEEIEVKDYVDRTDDKELEKLSDKIKTDKIINRSAVKSEKDKIKELNSRKDNYNTQAQTQALPAVIPEEMSFLNKFRKRREFLREREGEGKIKSFFKSFSKKRDQEVFAQGQKKVELPSEFRESILVKAEDLREKGKNKEEIKATIKAGIFESMEKDDPLSK